MLKKLIARILVLTLLVQCVPVEAVAEAGNSLLLSQQELDSLSAQYDLDSTEEYHDGMAYSESFSLAQVVGYLYYLQYSQVDPLSNTVEMLIGAIAKAGPPSSDTQTKLRTLDAFMFNLHRIKDEITGCIEALEQSVAEIQDAAACVWDTEYYSYAQRAGYSSRVKKAQDRIAATLEEIKQKQEGWEQELEDSEQAIRIDGKKDVHINTARNGLGASGGSYVVFTDKGKTLQGEQSDGGWQLRDLYAELDSSRPPELFTVSPTDLGLKSAPSLLERLSPVSTAYADRQQDATVTVIDDNQFAVEARDENGAPIEGMIVCAIDADKMYEDGPHKFVVAKTGKNGAAVFDIPGNFTLDFMDKLNLYIEYPAGTGTLVTGARAGEPSAHQSAYLWNVYIDRGTSYQHHLAQDVGTPYVASVCYNSQDVTQSIATFYYAAGSNLTHRCFVKIGNPDTATGTVRLRYTSAEEKDKEGNYTVVRETAAGALTATEDGFATAEIKGPFGHMFLPGQPVYLVYEDAAHAGENALVQALNVDIEAGQLPSPYSGTMKPLDINTSVLFNCSLPVDFNIIPGASFASPSFGLDMPLNIPRLSVSFVPRGSIAVSLGVDLSGDYFDALHWNQKFPEPPAEDPPVEETAGGPQRPTEQNSETGGGKLDKMWSILKGKTLSNWGDKLQNLRDFGKKDKTLKYPGKVLNNSISFEPLGAFVGTIQNLGEDPEKGTLSVLNANASVGAEFLYSGDFCAQGTLFFVGVSWSVEVIALYTWGLAQDLYWKTDDKVSSTVSDYELVGKMRNVHSNDIFNIYIKLQVDVYCGFGIHGFVEVSLHGYIYIAFNIAIYMNGTDKVDPPYKLKNPHFTISFGGGLYILLKLILLRVRFDLLPKDYERNIVFHSNWPHEIDLGVAPWQEGWEKKLEEEAGMTAAKSSTANPALRAARAAQAEADEAESQDVSSIPAVYNPDLLIDTENSEDNAVFKGLETLNGKVAYACISGGKYRNQDDMAIHTYAFFLVPDEVGRPRLSYIDLDAETPTVYNFDAELDESQFVDWQHLKDYAPWGESYDIEPAVNMRAERSDTRAGDPEMYDYDFAVASVADNNKHVDGGGQDEAPLDGMSAVVCVLSSSELVDAEADLGSGQKTTVQQPGGTLYATSFVATRIDAKTGKLSMIISRIGPPYDTLRATDLQCSKQVITGLATSATTAPESFTNPEITAAYKNVTFGEPPTGENINVNANVYEAIVTFRPDNVRNNNYTYDRHVLRYRSYVGQEMWLSILLEDTYGNESDSAAKRELARSRLTQFRLCDVYQPQASWKKQDANGNPVDMALGPTVSFSVLPFEVDTSGFQDMWKDTEDFGPQVSWLEMRRFEGSDEMQFYRFYESKEDTVDSDYAGWPLGAVDWVPLNPTSLDTLIGRKGMGIVGHITPWNAGPKTEEAFFFYADEDGQSYLDSVRLSDGVLTDYGISVPAADVGCVDAGESIIFYWPTTQTPVDLEKGGTDPGFAIKTMVYEKNSGVLFAPVSIAEIAADRDTPPTKTFMTKEGMCYFALTRTTVESDGETGVSTATGSTTLDFYKFEPQYTMGVEFLSADFADGAVRPGAYDDIMMLMRNNGNVPISGLTLEVYDVDKDEGEKLMETIDIDLLDPEDSTVTYTGFVDEYPRTETGEKVVSVTGNGKARKRGEWAVMEATPTYPGGSAPSRNALPTGWDTESTYLTTKSLIPLDTTSLQAPILIGVDWKGTHTIRFKIKQLRSTNAWAVDLEGNETRAARNAERKGVTAVRESREVAVTRMEDGRTAVHYADKEPQSGGISLIDTLLGREAPSVPPHYSAAISFDEIDLDTGAEDLTLSMRHYIRPADGMEMVQLTAHNTAHADGEPKCVVLYAYGDYSYDDVWPVYDFGDLNAGQSVTVTLPLSAILTGHNVKTLLLDLHIDHGEARKHGVTADALKNHRHDGSDIINGCIHDVNVFNDYVELELEDDILQIVQQPSDVYLVTGGAASFSVSVRGGALPYSYRWQVRKPLLNGDGSHKLDKDGNWLYGDWEDWPGGNAITLELAATAEMNGWQFHVIVTDMYGRSVTSAFATLWLTDIPMTGDEARPGLWLLLACAALATALITAKKRRRHSAAR